MRIQKNDLIEMVFFEHPKHIFQLIDKKITIILHYKVLAQKPQMQRGNFMHNDSLNAAWYELFSCN